jgi:hypothetical protein
LDQLFPYQKQITALVSGIRRCSYSNPQRMGIHTWMIPKKSL